MITTINLGYGNEVIPEFKTRTAVYTKAVVKKIEPDGIRISHEFGFAKVKFDELTPEQRDQFRLTEENRDKYIRMQHELLIEKTKAEQEASRIKNQQKSEPSKKEDSKSKGPRYITPDQIKIHWYNKMPTLRKLDRDYYPAMKAKEIFLKEIRAGHHDLAAKKAAAEYNKNEALKFNDINRANLFENEIVRIVRQEEEIQRQKDEAEARFQQLRLQKEVSEIHSKLEELETQILTMPIRF